LNFDFNQLGSFAEISVSYLLVAIVAIAIVMLTSLIQSIGLASGIKTKKTTRMITPQGNVSSTEESAQERSVE
jgi:hypothetical protein